MKLAIRLAATAVAVYPLAALGSLADYQRALGLQAKARDWKVSLTAEPQAISGN
jgi:hypothetical protein